MLPLCLWAVASVSWGQTPEWARVYATHESLSQAVSEEDRMALHGQLMGLWKEALASGHAFEVDWSGWNNAVVDLGEDNERLLVFTWNGVYERATDGSWSSSEDRWPEERWRFVSSSVCESVLLG